MSMEIEPPNRIESVTLQRSTTRQGNYYLTLGLFVLAGLVAVLAAGYYGIRGLGIFTVEQAMPMIGLSIAILGAAATVGFVSLRHTMTVLGKHEAALLVQSQRHAELAKQVQTRWRQQQLEHDRRQDDEVAGLARMQRETQERLAAVRPRAPRAASEVRFGNVYNVIDIEGIGETFASALQRMGIHSTSKLWEANPDYVAGRLGVAPKTVESWQAMAELMALKGIGPQYAELLVRSGITSIQNLASKSADHLLALVTKAEAGRTHRIQKNPVGPNLAENWIDAAKFHLRMEVPA